MKIDTLLKRRATLSFEIFPPKKQTQDLASIYDTIASLAAVKPDFISVTYGAGGSTTKETVKIASTIKNKYGIEAVAHLTCIDSNKEQVLQLLKELKAENIENILSLRGDYPIGYELNTDTKDFQHASDLNRFIEEHFPNTFCLSGACYPEVHEEADSLERDLLHLKEKVDAGAKYLVTQIFFDNNYYYRLLREAKKRGINTPIIAGIMPAINAKQLLRMSKLCGCSIPYKLSAMIERFSHNEKAMKEVGLNFATYQIMDLIAHGAQGIHLYTMNRPDIATEILKRIEHIKEEFEDD